MKMENASPGRIILKLDKGYSGNTTAISATLNIHCNLFVSLWHPLHFSQPKKRFECDCLEHTRLFHIIDSTTWEAGSKK